MSCINCSRDFFTGQLVSCRRCAEMAHQERMAATRRVSFFAPVVIEREVEVERVVVRDRGAEAVGIGLAVGTIFGAIFGAATSGSRSEKSAPKKQISSKKR